MKWKGFSKLNTADGWMAKAYLIVTRCHTTDGVTADREDELRDMVARYASGEVDFETLEGVYIWNKEE